MWTQERRSVILIMDDPVVASLLRDAAYRVIEAKTDDAVLAQINQDAPEIFLINMMGDPPARLAFVRQLRARLGSAPQSIFAIAPYESELADSAIEAGASEIIPYPVRSKTLLSRLLLSLRYTRMFNELRQQRIVADALIGTAAALSSTLELDKIYSLVLDNVRRVVPADAANLMLIEDKFLRVARAIGYTQETDILKGARAIAISERPIVQQLLKEQRTILTADAKRSQDWSSLSEDDWIGSNIAVPLLYSGETIGVLFADSAMRNRFSNADAQRLQAFADQAATAIHNARLYRSVTRQTESLEERVNSRTRELDFERRRFQAILDSMAEGVMMVEVSSVLYVRYVNRALTTMLGYNDEDWKIHHVGLLRPPHQDEDDFWTDIWEIVDEVRERGEVRFERRLVRKNRTEIEVRVIVTQLMSAEGDMVGVVGVFEDMTEMKALDEKKKRFVADASHELRNPITTIKNRLYILRRQPHKLEEHLTVLDLVTETISRLVEDLLDLSRFERGVIPLAKTRFELQRLVDQVVLVQELEAERATIMLRSDLPEIPVYVTADWERLVQVLTNLVNNAIQHTPPHGSVTVSVRLDDAYAVLIVTDTGDGIEAQHLPNIFQPFYRADHSRDGTGLGLSIAREITAMHGGDIHVTSEVGKGSSFEVHLPLSPSETTTATLPVIRFP
jgi:two-component system phosphate regulon sensor histidine kinase PhoR